MNKKEQVVRTYEDGSVYEGEEVNGKRHGVGKQKYPNGMRYIGYWKNDAINGEGKLYS